VLACVLFNDVHPRAPPPQAAPLLWRRRLRRKLQPQYSLPLFVLRSRALDIATAFGQRPASASSLLVVVRHSLGSNWPVVYHWHTCLALASVCRDAWRSLGDRAQGIVQRHHRMRRQCLLELPWLQGLLQTFAAALALVAESLQWWEHITEVFNRPPEVPHMVLLLLFLANFSSIVPNDAERRAHDTQNQTEKPPPQKTQRKQRTTSTKNTVIKK